MQTNDSRPLVGQPDQVANGVLEWVHPTWGSGLRLLYNFTGEKVSFVGANGLPDVLEQPRATLALAFTNPLHGLVWPTIELDAVTGTNVAIYGHGIAYWVSLAYYLALYALLRWPPSLAEPDLLFLIPPGPWWIQPVWVPVAVSCAMIAGGAWLFARPARNRPLGDPS